ncbi:hypothetical protein EGW08_018480, partial [Elysia chlorotica]
LPAACQQVSIDSSTRTEVLALGTTSSLPDSGDLVSVQKTMKVTAAERQRSRSILGVKRDSRSCIMKAAAATSIEQAGLSEEMNDCLLQLSGMVPHVPKNEKGNIEAAVLIQYVIDYILDLSQQLGGQNPFCSRSSPLHYMGESREPLSEKTLENIVSCQVSISFDDTLHNYMTVSDIELCRRQFF